MKIALFNLSDYTFLLLFFPQAICKTAENIAKPIIAEQIPKYKIESAEFQKLTLGCLPPTFQGWRDRCTLFVVRFVFVY